MKEKIVKKHKEKTKEKKRRPRKQLVEQNSWLLWGLFSIMEKEYNIPKYYAFTFTEASAPRKTPAWNIPLISRLTRPYQ